jgi:hypothetical protein
MNPLELETFSSMLQDAQKLAVHALVLLKLIAQVFK